MMHFRQVNSMVRELYLSKSFIKIKLDRNEML